MTPNVNISTVCCQLLAAIPPVETSDQASEKTVSKASDLLFAFLHAYLQTLGFRLNPPTSSPDTPTSNVLPATWNSTPEAYSLKYSHERSSLSFVLKGVVLADKLLVHCVAVEDGSIYSHEYSLRSTFKDATTFPWKIPSVPSCASVESETPVLTADENPFLPLFVDGVNGLEGVLYQFKTTIVDKVAPNLNKEGYEASSSSSSRNNTAGGSSSRRDPLRDYGREEDGGYAPPYPGRGYPGRPIPGYGTGDIDLDPFGAAPGLIPPRGGFGGMHPGGGMHVGPDHPMFGGGGGGFGPPGGLYGGPGAILPPGAVPPNARFDPIGPLGGRPGMYPGGGNRGGFGGVGNPFGDGGMGGGFPGGISGIPGRGGFGGRGGGRGGGVGGYRMGPDNDEMPPPGFGDDMYS
ncbi:hypothetical protein BDR26DRAFT_916608 [Obelidium mucronatum]|nr:hypothetical protein BDR26DRAFT_916608 [Obelidium mucronatum]